MLRITFGCLWAAFLALASGSFVYVDQELSWTDARDYCRTHHDDLASIHSSTEQAAVAALCPSGTNGCWIGGSDSAQEGTWTWSDGTAWDYTNWNTNEPNDFKVHTILGEDHLKMDAGGKWNDLDNNCVCCCPSGFVCATSDFPAGMFTFQAGHCYPQSEAAYINTPRNGGIQNWPVNIYEGGSPQQCYDECVGDSDYMGLNLRLTSSSPTGHNCMCNRPRG